MDKTQTAKLRVALVDAGIGELLLDRFIDGVAATCGEACYYGCAACCSSGTANRAAFSGEIPRG